MNAHVFATDYDGTIAERNSVSPATAKALERVRATGRKLLLVTGRMLPDLQRVCPDADRMFDAVVAGRPSERWGQEVIAIVQLRPGSGATPSDLLAAAGKHLARYKLPKQFVFRDKIERSPSGKADYRWAKEQAEKG